MKDYLGFENARNKQHAALYEKLMKRSLAAIGDVNVAVLIGHHLTFEVNGYLQTENEVPSADCLIFDHEFMTRVFSFDAIAVMRDLATVPAEKRDALLDHYLSRLELAEKTCSSVTV